MKRQLFLTLSLFYALSINAQNSVNSSGGEGMGTGGTTSFTSGQVFYTTTGSTFSNSQGVQQSFKIIPLNTRSKTTLVAKISVVVDNDPISASVFPNPAVNYIILNIGSVMPKYLNYKLYDINGRAVATGLIQQKQTQIPLPYLVAGSYILNVNQHTKLLKSFIIIKN